ncbi:MULTISPECIES: hypothetical protein [Commensalibacter]|uniref:Uncharacterized protein n=1 Tax=Commensalibacter papalotli (ex Botero et al. 2024) TaxID=2972766 RepID=A0ABM9HS55_9PROT|nr:MULTISPECIES: hypothetical protein [Commensalibacter]CAI3939856.1 unnamed protein product [Commensalibacter papalotli (ex Botero et al. 2024)]CAI3951144.1 unnamed protein product [Commensalibacter papalotli (ex Botero et al. 2024)]
MHILKLKNWLKVCAISAVMILIKPMLDDPEFLINLFMTWE